MSEHSRRSPVSRPSPIPPPSSASSGRLYVVGTPIGNLEDITLRALRILREADLIAAEDTRVTRKLLSHFDIHTPSTSYHQHSSGEKARALVADLLAGKSIALVSDAGMPGISDPGWELIRAAVEAGVEVVAVPGPTAAVSALAISGLPTARFAFDAFPPRTAGERRAFFTALREEPRTVVLYESPRRLVVTLKSIQEMLGERRIAVAREMTKVFEEVVRGTVGSVIAHYTAHTPIGECVIVIEGAAPGAAQVAEDVSSAVLGLLQELLAGGMSERDAVRQTAAQLRQPRRAVYAAALALKREPG
jgi:16S rRNA (cytidine1402-2'-O)-methyltransferase